jgi:hypothetical protein
LDSLDSYISELASSHPAVREHAARSLFALGVHAKRAIPALLHELDKNDPYQPWIGTAVQNIGARVEDVPQLQKLLHHADVRVRFWAARFAVKMGPAAAPMIADLIFNLSSDDQPWSDSVTWALSSIGEAAIPSLAAAIANVRSSARPRAIVAVSQSTAATSMLIPLIANSLGSGDQLQWTTSVRCLCSLAESISQGRREVDDEAKRTLVASLIHASRDEYQWLSEVESLWVQRALSALSI